MSASSSLILFDEPRVCAEKSTRRNESQTSFGNCEDDNYKEAITSLCAMTGLCEGTFTEELILMSPIKTGSNNSCRVME